MQTRACLLAFLLTIGCGFGAEFDLGARGTLAVTVPEDWMTNGKAVNRPDGTSLGYAMALKPRGDVNAKCLITWVYTTNRPPDKAVIRQDVLRATGRFVAGSVEQKQELKDFALEKGYGCYCVFTDASLVGKPSKPGDFKILASGEVQPAENLLGVVSLFADTPDGPQMKAMLGMINSLKVKAKETK